MYIYIYTYIYIYIFRSSSRSYFKLIDFVSVTSKQLFSVWEISEFINVLKFISVYEFVKLIRAMEFVNVCVLKNDVLFSVSFPIQSFYSSKKNNCEYFFTVNITV